MSFETRLRSGQIGEGVIAKWCQSRGHCVVPVYEKEIGSGKGPRFHGPEKSHVAPDMLILPRGNKPPVWIEAKNKSVFSWHRQSDCWCTGIDLHHYEEYLQVQAESEKQIWLLFLHTCETPDDRDAMFSPEKCPVGLFGNSLNYLMLNENHRHGNWGNHGMVYWAHKDLRLLESLASLSALAA